MAALSTPTGYPVIQVLYGATKSKAGTTVMMRFLLWNGRHCDVQFSRVCLTLDVGFCQGPRPPLPGFLLIRKAAVFHNEKRILRSRIQQVHPRLRIPFNSLALAASAIALLPLINIGSTTTLYAILSPSTIALYIPYVLPIIFFTLAKFRGDPIPYGPFPT
jgi:choline transport protein